MAVLKWISSILIEDFFQNNIIRLHQNYGDSDDDDDNPIATSNRIRALTALFTLISIAFRTFRFRCSQQNVATQAKPKTITDRRLFPQIKQDQ